MNGTRERSYLEAALAGEVEKVRGAAEGTRDETINAAAFSLGTLIPAGLDRQKAYDALTEAAIATGFPQRDARYKVTRALDQGQANPRTIPETNGHAGPYEPRQPTDSQDYLSKRGLRDRELLARSGVTLHPDRVEITQDGYTVKRWTDDRDPRYDNDPGEKPVFRFGDTEGSEVVGVAEGPFDALAAAQAGLPTVCSLGSFTNKTGEALRDKRKVLLIRDSDKGGQSFETKARAMLEGVEVETVSMPEGYVDLGEVAERASDPIAAVRDVLATAHDPGSDFVRLSEVEREPVEWIEKPYLPKGKAVLVYGDPGLGKTTVLLEWTARITRGESLFGTTSAKTEPRSVIWLTAEDGIADTLVPRLESAGADLTRVHAFRGVGRGKDYRPPSFPEDLPRLRRQIEKTRAALVVFDPLEAYLSGETNTWRSSDVRRALHPLKETAEATGATFGYIAHMTKGGGGNALYRALGSIAFMAAVRAALLVTPDPNDDDRRVLSVAKMNVAKAPPSLLFRLTEDPTLDVARISWEGESDLNARDLLDVHDDSGTAQGEARDLLRKLLSDGKPHSREVISETIRAETGCSEKTISRARKRLGVKASPVHQDGRISGWVWQLPTEGQTKSDPETVPEKSAPEEQEREPDPELPPVAEVVGTEEFGPGVPCSRCSVAITYAYFSGEPICPACRHRAGT